MLNLLPWMNSAQYIDIACWMFNVYFMHRFMIYILHERITGIETQVMRVGSLFMILCYFWTSFSIFHQLFADIWLQFNAMCVRSCDAHTTLLATTPLSMSSRKSKTATCTVHCISCQYERCSAHISRHILPVGDFWHDNGYPSFVPLRLALSQLLAKPISPPFIALSLWRSI